MKRFIKELLILLIQLFFFYIFPLFMGPRDAIGMVAMIILATFILSLLLGVISKGDIKYLYPPITAFIFIPSVFIYYNESALVHCIWYLIISYVGVLLGTGINKLTNVITKKEL